jgi:ankyrin repeat protein
LHATAREGTLLTVTYLPRDFAMTQPEARQMNDEEAAQFAEQVFDVARNGDAQMLERLLEKGLPPNLRNHNGDTLLMLATYHGHLDAARVLLQYKADPLIANDKNQLPMAGAAFKGNLPMVQLLIEEGAPVDGASADGRTALMMAAMFNRTEMVEYLLAQGANPVATDAQGINALGAARAMGATLTIAQLEKLAA